MSEISTLPSMVVRPGDKRYPALSRGFNQRWVAEPEYVRLVRTPEEVHAALASHLYPVSGKALPGGSCYSVGLGGHIPAGGFGLLSRQHGLTVDYFYAVEVAVVEEGENVQLVVAKRDDKDARLGELLWAHTGGGGGNFGVVTRFWFRGLPEPPKQVLLTALAWDWKDFTRDEFATLVTAYGEYFWRRWMWTTRTGHRP